MLVFTDSKGIAMSDHFSGDRRLGLTDVFVFASADDPDKTVLIICSNPASAAAPAPAPTTGAEFYPGAVYRINVDNDYDALADVAFTFVFSELENGAQSGTAWYATGPEARQREPAGGVLASSIPVSFGGAASPVQAGPIRLFTGWRSDPSFADIEGVRHGFQWTGHDDFASSNVDSIALEVPTDMLGTDLMIGVWATISQRRDGGLEQVGRGGNPALDAFMTPDERDLFNSRLPSDDVVNYLEPWSGVLENGGYPPAEARAAARQVLPDILRYYRTMPAAYPNGRALTDDVYSMRVAWLTHGRVPPTGLRPHGDLLPEFPYLGPPHP